MEEFTTGKVSCYHHCLFFPEKKSKQSVARNLNPFILLTANCRFVFECNFVKKKLIEEYTIGQVSWYNHRLFSARKNPNRVQQENFTVFSSNCQFVFEGLIEEYMTEGASCFHHCLFFQRKSPNKVQQEILILIFFQLQSC